MNWISREIRKKVSEIGMTMNDPDFEEGLRKGSYHGNDVHSRPAEVK